MIAGAILGIDPGTRKVGFAVASDAASAALALGVEPVETLAQRLRALDALHAIRAVALGGGTHAAHVARIVAALGVPVHVVDETDTTYRARALYFADHPPAGWRRLIPLGLQLPPRPVDDYAALLIARRFLEQEVARDGSSVR
ncbi:MAG: pre-16S rRNA-processing nuclease YqgF [Candidatus Baltobacteraceae bacterium]